ncbi:hypothetical protein V0288_12090 [Pannus brasiliensis CCIBt3594]|uniref:Uncharacterized protein n=1 Tax=Pannus brasiliensis CCIBt3594 TaxID=1427578 RepID=A0AAW9QWF2_9CHRO
MSGQQVSFHFRYQPKKESRHGILVSYLKEDEGGLTRHQRVLQPIAAFWLPFAYQAMTDSSSAQIRQIARSSIYQLKLHIQYLEESFGLGGNSEDFDPSIDRTVRFPTNDIPPNEAIGPDGDDRDFSDEDDILDRIC